MPSEYREERLMRVLREQIIDTIQGAQRAVIVTNDGLVVAAYPATDEEKDVRIDAGSSHWTAALAAEIIAQSRRAFGELSQGEVSRILIDGESGSMIVVPADDRTALAVLVDTQTKLGLAMYQIARVALQVEELLN